MVSVQHQRLHPRIPSLRPVAASAALKKRRSYSRFVSSNRMAFGIQDSAWQPEKKYDVAPCGRRHPAFGDTHEK